MWTAGVPAGAAFDALCPCPALVKLIADGCVPPGRTLVPGCGRGYDVAALVAKDRNVLGLDIAPLAIDAARKHACEVVPQELLANLQLETTSFFELPTSSYSDKFTFIYDYTFLCALDPSVRPQWARKMADLPAPGGGLCTLIFPIGNKEVSILLY